MAGRVYPLRGNPLEGVKTWKYSFDGSKETKTVQNTGSCTEYKYLSSECKLVFEKAYI